MPTSPEPTLAQRILADMKTAMIAKDSVTLNVVRNLKSSLKYAAIEKHGADSELSEVDSIPVIRKELKKLQDSLDGSLKANRPELAEQAKAEIAVLERFLPAAMSNDEVTAIVDAVIAELGATSKKEMGAVMKAVQERTAGRADNKVISAEVAKRLP